MIHYFHAEVEMKIQILPKCERVEMCIPKNHIALHN